jgi:uncharacterized protein
MTRELLNKQQLQILNKHRLNYPLAIAEKDYLLALTLEIIFNSGLKNALIFKGGTALHHTYLPQLRFSQDLDFTALKPIAIEELLEIFEPYNFLRVKKHYTSPATLKLEKLSYSGPLELPGWLKIEIDFKQNVAMPARNIVYNNAYGVKVEPLVMDIKEICAEKIRAMNERFRYRDFYDFGMIMKTSKLDLQEVFDLLKQKELRQPLKLKNIMDHWLLASQAKKQDLAQIYVTLEIAESEIATYLNQIPLD